MKTIKLLFITLVVCLTIVITSCEDSFCPNQKPPKDECANAVKNANALVDKIEDYNSTYYEKINATDYSKCMDYKEQLNAILEKCRSKFTEEQLNEYLVVYCYGGEAKQTK